jgi:hypothetical protein
MSGPVLRHKKSIADFFTAARYTTAPDQARGYRPVRAGESKKLGEKKMLDQKDHDVVKLCYMADCHTDKKKGEKEND